MSKEAKQGDKHTDKYNGKERRKDADKPDNGMF